MLTTLRQKQIVEYVNEQGSATVTELCSFFDASESTIRRDIAALDGEGQLTKVFGGAVRKEADNVTALEFKVEDKRAIHVEEKRAIGKFAATLIRNDECVYIDAGTTTEAMLEFVRTRNATYVTNAMLHAMHLASQGFKVILIGGDVKSLTQAAVGAQTVEELKQFHFTKGFFGANGVSAKCGCTTPDNAEAMVKRTAMRQCKERYVLADNSKFDVITSVTFGDFDSSTFITEATPPGFEDFNNILVVG